MVYSRIQLWLRRVTWNNSILNCTFFLLFSFNSHETTMYLAMCSVIFLSSVEFTFSSRDNILQNRSPPDDSVILKDILKNYMQKYFSNKKLFVSINLPPNEWSSNHYGNNMLDELFSDSILENFSYNVLRTLNGSTSGNHNAFNLILVDKTTHLT